MQALLPSPRPEWIISMETYSQAGQRNLLVDIIRNICQIKMSWGFRDDNLDLEDTYSPQHVEKCEDY